jgi:Ca2+/Na+ antiporter
LDAARVHRIGNDDGKNDGVGFDGMGRTTEELDGTCQYECEDERDLSQAENDCDYDEADLRHDDLIRLPRDSSRVGLVVWFILYPLRLIMHHTIPDVGKRRGRLSSRHRHRRACASTASCLIWLCVSSYVMVTSLENLAETLDMPDAVMGATVSAAGTSYPAYVASIMAASDGMGNRAVSNVFGSNTFNICVGLGMPWMAYIALTMGFGPYTDLEENGVVESMAILFGTLLIFVVLLASTDFVLVEWHANFFVGLYVLYIVYTIGDVYW